MSFEPYIYQLNIEFIEFAGHFSISYWEAPVLYSYDKNPIK